MVKSNISPYFGLCTAVYMNAPSVCIVMELVDKEKSV